MSNEWVRWSWLARGALVALVLLAGVAHGQGEPEDKDFPLPAECLECHLPSPMVLSGVLDLSACNTGTHETSLYTAWSPFDGGRFDKFRVTDRIDPNSVERVILSDPDPHYTGYINKSDRRGLFRSIEVHGASAEYDGPNYLWNRFHEADGTWDMMVRASIVVPEFCGTDHVFITARCTDSIEGFDALHPQWLPTLPPCESPIVTAGVYDGTGTVWGESSMWSWVSAEPNEPNVPTDPCAILDCNDGDDCTADDCLDGLCVHTLIDECRPDHCEPCDVCDFDVDACEDDCDAAEDVCEDDCEASGRDVDCDAECDVFEDTCKADCNHRAETSVLLSVAASKPKDECEVVGPDPFCLCPEPPPTGLSCEMAREMTIQCDALGE